MKEKLTYKKLLEILELRNLDEFLTSLVKYFFCIKAWSYANGEIYEISFMGKRNRISDELFELFSFQHTGDKCKFYDLILENSLTIQHNDGILSKPKIILIIVIDKFDVNMKTKKRNCQI